MACPLSCDVWYSMRYGATWLVYGVQHALQYGVMRGLLYVSLNGVLYVKLWLKSTVLRHMCMAIGLNSTAPCCAKARNETHLGSGSWRRRGAAGSRL